MARKTTFENLVKSMKIGLLFHARQSCTEHLPNSLNKAIKSKSTIYRIFCFKVFQFFTYSPPICTYELSRKSLLALWKNVVNKDTSKNVRYHKGVQAISSGSSSDIFFCHKIRYAVTTVITLQRLPLQLVRTLIVFRDLKYVRRSIKALLFQSWRRPHKCQRKLSKFCNGSFFQWCHHC